MLVLILSAAALLGAAEPAPASAPQSSTQPAPVQVLKPNADLDKVRCVRISDTGSNFTRRECHTNEQWQAIKATEGEYLRDQQVNRGPASH